MDMDLLDVLILFFRDPMAKIRIRVFINMPCFFVENIFCICHACREVGHNLEMNSHTFQN